MSIHYTPHALPVVVHTTGSGYTLCFEGIGNQATLERHRYRFGATLDVELRKNVADVGLHGVFGDIEHKGNGAVAFATHHVLKYLKLTGR